jgi:hypothetical protein
MAHPATPKDPVAVAELRGKITAYLNDKMRWCGTREIKAAFSGLAEQAGYAPASVYWIMDSMANNNLIKRAKRNGVNVYAANAVAPPIKTAEPAKAVEVPVTMVKAPTVSTTMLLDVVQSTGRLRITMGGITLEIGVVK